ncbi:MAG: hypothetical protein LBO76_02485 [Treponema sp.]|jgi:hypothetical protein|nr:hypothetical protein [Treponema sp.]
MIAGPGKLDGQRPEDRGGYGAARGGPDSALFLPGQAKNGAVFDPEYLRKKINSEEYIYEAIQRIAQVLSSELLKMSRGRIYHERQRKRRK